MNVYKLPPLPYSYDALEPHIDERTMRLHHDKHHRGYVEGANEGLRSLEKAMRLYREKGPRDRRAARRLIKARKDFLFNLGGHVNHSRFWQLMTPGSRQRPRGPLRRHLKYEFGTLNNFRRKFDKAAVSLKGSGWAMLLLNLRTKRLRIAQLPEQSMAPRGYVPILMLDVWEHAYYLSYENRRAEYVDSWWNIVNWRKARDFHLQAFRKG